MKETAMKDTAMKDTAMKELKMEPLELWKQEAEAIRACRAEEQKSIAATHKKERESVENLAQALALRILDNVTAIVTEAIAADARLALIARLGESSQQALQPTPSIASPDELLSPQNIQARVEKGLPAGVKTRLVDSAWIQANRSYSEGVFREHLGWPGDTRSVPIYFPKSTPTTRGTRTHNDQWEGWLLLVEWN